MSETWKQALDNKRQLDRLERACGNPTPVFAYTDGVGPMSGNSPDEEHVDPHGECRHEIVRLRAALEEIRDANIPDQPAAHGGTDLEWAQRHVGRLRRIARDALITG